MIGDAEGQLFLVESEGDNSLQKIHELQLDGLLLSPLVGAAGSAYAVVREDSGDAETRERRGAEARRLARATVSGAGTAKRRKG